VELLARTTHEHSQQIHEHSQQITEIMEAAARLLHIAQIHEQRLTRLEGGAQ
jgi:ABC-type cobalamin/Fe3+-siderophores transport system ATPase subunit